MNFREAIKALAKENFSNTAIKVAKVLSVTDSTCTVQLLDTEFEIPDVRLQTSAASGVYYKPSIDSMVVIAPIDDFEYVVVMFSDLDEIQLLDGSFGGLVKAGTLTTKLNNLEAKVNDLISFINTHTHASDGTPPAPTYSGGTLTETTQNEIQSDKITHGTV